MKKYRVDIPFTGYVTVEVEAGSAEAAIETAMSGELDLDDITEMEYHRHVTRGNVCSAVLKSANAEEI